MTRSLKKWPYIDVRLVKKINTMNDSGKKGVIKTWARASTITPEFVWHTFGVHNGKAHFPVFVTEDMVWHKLWEFSMTRTFRGHAWKK
jgi:small subunit ribosomal protein S19